jgi:hypothetical protein
MVRMDILHPVESMYNEEVHAVCLYRLFGFM